MLTRLKNWTKKNQKYLSCFLIYTVLWLVAWIIGNIVLLVHGKGLIWNDDSLSSMYEYIQYEKALFDSFLKDLIGNSQFRIPWNNYNLTAGDNISYCMTGFEILNWIYVFIPYKLVEIVYGIHILFRSWFSGIAFLAYCFYRKKERLPALLGSLVYVFCGYTFRWALPQPELIYMMWILPFGLIGLEQILERKSKALFTFNVWILFLGWIVYPYYLSVVFGLYFLVRCIEYKTTIKQFFLYTFQIILCYVIGFGLSAVVSLPNIIYTLNSGRISKGLGVSTSLLYSIDYYISEFCDWFIVSSGNGINYSIIALVPLIYLIFHKKKLQGNRLHVILILILVNIPLFNLIAGAGIENTRWIFYLSFWVAFVLVDLLPEVIALKEARVKWKLTIIAVIYSLTVFILVNREKQTVVLTQVILLFLAVIIFHIIWRIQERKTKYSILLMAFYSTLMISGVVYFSERFYGKEKMLLDYRTADAYLDTYVDSAALQIDDKSFYRIDKASFTDETSCNLLIGYGYNGISSFTNRLEPSAVEYFMQMENTGMLQANKFASLGAKATDEALACVKYYLVDESKGEAVIPYGFEFLENSQMNSEQKIYVNSYALPIGYTYESSITKDIFDTLNIAQKEEVLLKSVLLEEETVIKKENAKTELKSKAISWELVQSEGVIRTDEGWFFESGDSYVTFVVSPELMGEIYVELGGVVPTNNTTVKVAGVNGIEKAVIHTASSQRTNGMDTFAFNIGRIESEAPITVSFSNAGIFVDSIHVYIRDLSLYETDITLLSESTLENLSIKDNLIEGDIELDKNKIFCLSVPYTDGWKCYVDGKEVKILKANLMYMAVALGPGTHHLKWVYRPSGYVLGVSITLVSIVIIVFALVIKRKRIGKK